MLEVDDPTPVMVPSPTIGKDTEPVNRPGSANLAVLLEREKMYKTAMEHAEKAGQSSKVRRFGRGLKVVKSYTYQLVDTLQRCR